MINDVLNESGAQEDFRPEEFEDEKTADELESEPLVYEELDPESMSDEELEDYYTQLIIDRKADYFEIVRKRRKAAKGVIIRYGDYIQTPSALLALLAAFAIFDAADNFIPGDCLEKLRDLAVDAAGKIAELAKDGLLRLAHADASKLQEAARSALRSVALNKSFTDYWREMAVDMIREYDEETANMAEAILRAIPIAEVPQGIVPAEAEGIIEGVGGVPAEAGDEAGEVFEDPLEL